MLSGGRAFRRKDIEQYAQELDLLARMGVTAEPGVHRLHALQLAQVSDAPDSASPQLYEFLKRARKTVADFSGIPNASIDPVTLEFLRPYQRAGADFLVWAARAFGGALLADDMGLGKTLQLLAALTALRAESKTKAGKDRMPPSLVICPASVAHNWQREAAKFTSGLRVLVLESGAARKADLQRLAEYDLVVINYALLRRDLPALLEQPWLCVIVDEAQAIKNAAAETSRAVKQLTSRYRFALTGTPIENRISDIFSIVEFALPGYLGGIDLLAGDTANPAAQGTFHRALRARLRPVLLRRLKSEVATELPERIETRADCEMGVEQRKLYLTELKRARTMLDEMEGAAFRSTGKIQMLAALMRLRQICCDPVLINKPDVHSCKVDQLIEIVQPLIDAGHKVLLFSQFVKMLQHLYKVLDSSGVKTYMLTGATSRRQKLVEKFESDTDASVFLISLKAGGTGLNLISASHVVLFDPWWNPAVEAQAIDRSHRIGQDKTVVAYRLVTTDTIEERILELQDKKRALVRNVLEEEAFNRTLTRDDFQYLLR
jgi:SNF2 family DNA or RNA helicase